MTVAERLKAARAAAGPPPPTIGATISRAKAALAKAKGETGVGPPAAALSSSGELLLGHRSTGAVSEKPFSVFGSRDVKPRAPVSYC